MKKNIIAGVTLTITLSLDIITKYLIEKNFSYNGQVDFLGGFLRITLVYNEGGVFGILQGYKTMFLIISSVVLLIMVAYYFYEKNKTLIFTISMSLIISGALGNIIDRLLSHRPGVVDFISIGVDGVYRWPSFNVADMVIIIGAGLLVIVFYRDEKRKKAHGSQTNAGQ